jgi:hypothetical protein
VVKGKRIIWAGKILVTFMGDIKNEYIVLVANCEGKGAHCKHKNQI